MHPSVGRAAAEEGRAGPLPQGKEIQDKATGFFGFASQHCRRGHGRPWKSLEQRLRNYCIPPEKPALIGYPLAASPPAASAPAASALAASPSNSSIASSQAWRWGPAASAPAASAPAFSPPNICTAWSQAWRGEAIPAPPLHPRTPFTFPYSFKSPSILQRHCHVEWMAPTNP